MRLAPVHNLLTTKARIAAQHNPHLRPHGAHLGDDTLELIHGSGRGVDAGATQSCTQQMLSAKDVQRQITVLAVVAVKEPPFLMTMHRVVGRINVEHYLFGSVTV